MTMIVRAWLVRWWGVARLAQEGGDYILYDRIHFTCAGWGARWDDYRWFRLRQRAFIILVVAFVYFITYLWALKPLVIDDGDFFRACVAWRWLSALSVAIAFAWWIGAHRRSLTRATYFSHLLRRHHELAALPVIAASRRFASEHTPLPAHHFPIRQRYHHDAIFII